jgi:hypothetical protein
VIECSVGGLPDSRKFDGRITSSLPSTRNWIRSLDGYTPYPLYSSINHRPFFPVEQQMIPGAARVVVPGTGHLMYLEKSDLFSSIVINFLTSQGF